MHEGKKGWGEKTLTSEQKRTKEKEKSQMDNIIALLVFHLSERQHSERSPP